MKTIRQVVAGNESSIPKWARGKTFRNDEGEVINWNTFMKKYPDKARKMRQEFMRKNPDAYTHKTSVPRPAPSKPPPSLFDELSLRIQNDLQNLGVHDVEDLGKVTEEDLYEHPNGRRIVKELDKAGLIDKLKYLPPFLPPAIPREKK